MCNKNKMSLVFTGHISLSLPTGVYASKTPFWHILCIYRIIVLGAGRVNKGDVAVIHLGDLGPILKSF